MTTILQLLLLLLVCPIAMILMMRGMHSKSAQQMGADQLKTDGSLSFARLHELRNDLEARMEDPGARIYDLEASRPTTGATTAVRNN